MLTTIVLIEPFSTETMMDYSKCSQMAFCYACYAKADLLPSIERHQNYNYLKTLLVSISTNPMVGISIYSWATYLLIQCDKFWMACGQFYCHFRTRHRKAYTAYKDDAPDGYRHIMFLVLAPGGKSCHTLQILIDKVLKSKLYFFFVRRFVCFCFCFCFVLFNPHYLFIYLFTSDSAAQHYHTTQLNATQHNTTQRDTTTLPLYHSTAPTSV